MMNTTEHLLVTLAEECAEVQQNIAKALRFGLDDHAPNRIHTNARLIVDELTDLFGVYELLKESGKLPQMREELVSAKKERVQKWMKYAIERETLEQEILESETFEHKESTK